MCRERGRADCGRAEHGGRAGARGMRAPGRGAHRPWSVTLTRQQNDLLLSCNILNLIVTLQVLYCGMDDVLRAAHIRMNPFHGRAQGS